LSRSPPLSAFGLGKNQLRVVVVDAGASRQVGECINDCLINDAVRARINSFTDFTRAKQIGRGIAQ
jgi:hypothetical protein